MFQQWITASFIVILLLVMLRVSFSEHELNVQVWVESAPSRWRSGESAPEITVSKWELPSVSGRNPPTTPTAGVVIWMDDWPLCVCERKRILRAKWGWCVMRKSLISLTVSLKARFGGSFPFFVLIAPEDSCAFFVLLWDLQLKWGHCHTEGKEILWWSIDS